MTLAILPVLLLGCFGNDQEATTEPVATPPVAPVARAKAAARSSDITPIYVTVGAHLENKLPLPCGDSGCAGHCKDAYLRFRQNILDYAQLMNKYGASYNVQTNWAVVELEDACVDDATRASTTNGKHILVHLYEDLGAMIDTHAHEKQTERYDTSYNYADIYQLIANAGVPAESLSIVGGCIVGSDYQWGQFAGGYQGNHFPKTTWTPAAFTFPAVHDHDPEGEDFTSGMWNPGAFDWEPAAGRRGDAFYAHQASGDYAMIGSGYLHHCAGGYKKGDFWVASDYIEVLASHIAEGKAPAGKMYTATVAMNQNHFKDPAAYMPMLEQQLKALQPLVQSGQVVYAHFQELPDIWKSRYGGEPNLYRYDNIDPADYTCDGNDNPVGDATVVDAPAPKPKGKKGKGGKAKPAGERPPRPGGGGGKGGKARR